MKLLDTNLLIDYFRGKSEVIHFIDNQSKEDIAICSVIAMELYKGALNKPELLKIKKTLKGFLIINLNEEISNVALQLSEQYALSHEMKVPDTLIAATALIFDVEIRTYNLKDFRFIPGLKVSSSLE